MGSILPATPAREVEGTYRAYYHQTDLRNITSIILAWCVCFALLLWQDVHEFSNSPLLYLILGLRLVYIACCLGIVHVLWSRQADDALYNWLVLAWGIFSVAGSVLYYMARSERLIIFYLVDLVAILSFYVGIPNRLSIRVIPPLLYSLYLLIQTLVSAVQMSPVELSIVWSVFLLTNIGGFLLSRQYFALRRKDVILHEEEAIIRAELLRLASTDPLTGIFNRRSILELAGEAFYRYKRYQRPFAIILIDLDGFKQVNDTYGHQQGDHTLVQFSQVVLANKRQGDVLGRIGGDEFCLVLAESNVAAAVTLAERLLEQCNAIEVNQNQAFSVVLSASLGITEARPTDTTLDQVLTRADYALYRAKESGRDRWVVG